MASRKDYYFARSAVRGFGRLFFLKVPQRADQDSPAANLLGSMVVEEDYGPFGTKICPRPQNSYRVGIIRDIMKNDLSLSQQEIVNRTNFSGASFSTKISKSLSGSGNAPFPLALSLGLDVNYSKLRTADVSFGDETFQKHIPTDLLALTYQHIAKNSGDYADYSILMNDDRMVIDRALYSKKFRVIVESETKFDASFEAKAESAADTELGIKYERVSEYKYAYEVDTTTPYLIALGGVEADEYVD